MHSLKVCMVTPYYPPSVGGIERVVLNLSCKIRERGVSVQVYTGTHFGQAPKSDGVIQLPTKLAIIGNPLIPALTNAISADDFDVVHAHDEHAFTSNQVAYVRSKINRPFVMHCHGSYTGGSPLWRLFVHAYMKTLGSYTLRRADINIALSPSEADIIRKFGARKIRVIPNAVDPTEHNRNADPSLFRSRYSLGKRRLVLFVGRLIKVKGVHLLPEIAQRFNVTRENVVFAVVGDGPMRGKLEATVKRRGIKNIVITGRISQEMLSSAYAAADVVLAPSQSEGMPAVVLEAILFKKPVVATRLPTLTDYFEKVCTFVRQGDVEGYAKAVNETLRNPPKDVELESAEQLVTTHFNWNRVTSQVLDVYRELTW
ncbi:MAG: glycosyltransferase family 4 protein [Thermoprotei archaeon]